MTNHHRVIIIGAGAAGIGMAVTFKDFNMKDVLVIESGTIGQSFKQWPKSTKTITPSFTTNGFGMPDINAIAKETSPAFTFNEEHVSGDTYAEYLCIVAQHYDIEVATQTKVSDVAYIDGKYKLTTNKGVYSADYIYVATGDYAFPNQPFAYGQHYSEVDDFNNLNGNDFVIIGGNESAFDAAINLGSRGASVSIYTTSTGFDHDDADPSVRLSPYTHQRLREAVRQGAHIELNVGYKATEINLHDGVYQVQFENGHTATSSCEPIIATGFDVTRNPLIQQLFTVKDNDVRLTELDESTRYPNVFLIGATVRHEEAVLCYIYKFRARFAVLANILMRREDLPVDASLIDTYKKNNMYLDDYSCCEVDCSC
ncbi:NAD(P)/FAD-dependent oxidoreductase [Staphylococcus hominis]|uniref:NAD(P)/FAD-dependent oxidoreductase n=1 Tax=Staphylococcus hominis TaxID=1290 RepID=UPI000D1E0F2F|nr:NAD(P)/FAD-dependent oxidoreductase [Staphylococcus hominis]MCE4976415.1 NAD(P)-binding domain-containing protein [Staphylococcus hominis]PTK23270.1 pyridine nucleotide-disulfide oxidoreductase [Staphylococcus hominis]RIO52277.1 pyridine nucleotide-disulfide oxidoreductase [Staphylococcus hominis]